MAELLLELLSEEIPPSMQEPAAESLERLLREALKTQGCEAQQGDYFSTPRRIGIRFAGLPSSLAAQTETKRGPKTSAPQQAIDGFKRSLSGASAKIFEQDGYYFAQIERPAMEMNALLAEMIPQLLKTFSWPKSMRWPQNKDGSGDFRWVRPLRSILCLLDGEIVPFSIGGVQSGDTTYGHIFDAPDKIKISSFEDYQQKLRKAHVLIFAEDRREKIRQEIEKNKGDMEVQPEDIDLFVNQIARLAEKPTLIKSKVNLNPEEKRIDIHSLPNKITDSIFFKENCLQLPTKDIWGKDFLACIDGEKKNDSVIAAGFSTVLRARMNDALFFIENDHKIGLDRLREKLKEISFHPKLGSILDKAERFKKLSLGQTLRNLLPDKKWDSVIQPAAHYAKVDIASQSGREFPEALGQIAEELYYRENSGPIDSRVSDIPGDYPPSEDISDSIKEAILYHYETVPSTKASRILALAGRTDTLVGFFSIGEMPTGSKDPFALRRAALSIIQIILEHQNDFQNLDLNDLFSEALDLYQVKDKKKTLSELRRFIADRLKFYLRRQDQPADLVDAAMQAETGLNLARIQARLAALADFLKDENGGHLMIAWRRIAGILKDTKQAGQRSGAPRSGAPLAAALLTEPAEKKLAQALQMEGYDQALAAHDFPRAFGLLAALRAPVDDFFDHVRVNVDDDETRQNRLALCAAIYATMRRAADFSSIAGIAGRS